MVDLEGFDFYTYSYPYIKTVHIHTQIEGGGISRPESWAAYTV
jgi:hypothetical protein